MSDPKTEGIIQGWDRIASVLGITVRTAINWEADDPELQALINRDRSGRVWALEAKLRVYLTRRMMG